MKLELTAMLGTFYSLDNGFFLPTVEVAQGEDLVIAKTLPLSSMFEISLLNNAEGVRVGFYFVTRFTVRNGGGYLLTYMNNKAEAQSVETLLRNEHLVVYNYPNRGALAISPLVNQDIENIFIEQ